MKLRWLVLSSELSDIRVLRGFEAVQALDRYAQELESQRGSDLTSKQINILAKTARLLGHIMGTTEDCCVKAKQNGPQLDSENTDQEKERQSVL